MNEMVITLKADDRKYTQKFLIYEVFKAQQDDEVIQKCIAEARKSFEGEPENIIIKIILEVV